MIAIKIGVFAFRVSFDPLKLIFLQIFFSHNFTQNCEILKFQKIDLGKNVDIYPSKLLQKLSVTKIGLCFSKPILTP